MAGYRACCHSSVFAIKNALFSKYLCFDAKYSAEIPITDEWKSAAKLLASNAADAWKRKGQYEDVIKDKRFRECFFYTDMNFEVILPFASTGSFFIENGLQGQRLQSIYTGNHLASCEFWVLPNTNGKTYAGIAGISDNNPRVLKNMIDSAALVNDSDIATKLFQIAACNIENTYLDPSFTSNLATGTSHFIQAYHYRNCSDQSGYKRNSRSDNLSQMFPVSLIGKILSRSSNYSFKPPKKESSRYLA